MSIDAQVKTVIFHENGGGELRLIDRPAEGIVPPGIAGQPVLYYSEASEEVSALNGMNIWGGGETIMLGDRQIARRTGYAHITFEPRDVFIEAVKAYHEKRRRSQQTLPTTAAQEQPAQAASPESPLADSPHPPLIADPCQTCGHGKALHHVAHGSSLRCVSECGCRNYVAPADAPAETPKMPEAHEICTHCAKLFPRADMELSYDLCGALTGGYWCRACRDAREEPGAAAVGENCPRCKAAAESAAAEHAAGGSPPSLPVRCPHGEHQGDRGEAAAADSPPAAEGDSL